MLERRSQRRSTPTRALPRAASRKKPKKKRKTAAKRKSPRKRAPTKAPKRARASRVNKRGEKAARSAAAKKGWEKRRKRKALIDAMLDEDNWKQIWLPTGDELSEWMEWFAEQLDIDVSEAYQMYFAQGSPPK